MLILLPNKKDGLSSLEKNIDAKHLMNISSSMFFGNVDVSLPKFKLESTFKLNDYLKELGMPDVFDMDRADLSGMNASEQLYVSHVIHKADVDVNEEGNGSDSHGAFNAHSAQVYGRPSVFVRYSGQTDWRPVVHWSVCDAYW